MGDHTAIRDLREDELDAVLNLRRRCFEQHDDARERRRWAWQFFENPFRRADQPVAWVMEQDGLLVGLMGLIPWPIAIDGHPRAAACGTDFCIDPELRRHGLGVVLGRHFIRSAPGDFPFITSPTPEVLPLWSLCRGTVLPGAAEPCLWVWSGEDPASALDSGGLSCPEVAAPDERFDELAARLARRFRVLTLRDRRYLKWRYLDYPFGQPRLRAALGPGGELRGFSVFQVDARERRAYLLELCADPEDRGALRLLAESAVADARAAGLGELYVLTRVPEVQAALGEEGFHEVVDHALNFVARFDKGGPGPADWYLSGGDGDLLFSVGD